MKNVLGFLGAVLILQGLGALGQELLGWFRLWGLVRRVGLFSGYELYAGIGLVVLGAAVIGAGESLGRRAAGPRERA
ncbi:hypothetical protein [Streptomyces sp. HNM0574]|uniref:hypothetical protein n=1 Tax=Streptomyces sp. HNM0574 TaxID=2714954 RepID=UPI00146F1E0E|nr:hypothetical protein [Streptomyces sp. HNM0574]NLU70394.1 hypothetical protein [Streptomyces sp. HNM0574]